MASFYKNAKVDLTSTDVTTLYTAPAATTAVFRSLVVADDSGSTSTITVTVTDSASAVFVLYNVKATTANGTAELLTQPLVMWHPKYTLLPAYWSFRNDESILHLLN